MTELTLREVVDSDLPIFFENQLDTDANHMAAFTTKDPTDRTAFDAHWARIRADDSITIRTIVFDGEVAGHVLCFERDGKPEVSYWIGKPHWGKGIATRALEAFLAIVTKRPILARVATDNVGSLRVLEKTGFSIIDTETGYSNARAEDIDEHILQREN